MPRDEKSINLSELTTPKRKTLVVDEPELVETQEKGTNISQKKAHQILVDLIFGTIPQAEIYGIYVTHQILGESELSSEINVIVPKEMAVLVKLFLHVLQKKLYLQEYKLRAFNQLFEHQIKVKINQKRFLVILSIEKPLSQIHFVANCLKMNSRGEIKPLLFPKNRNRSEFLTKIHHDISRGRLELIGSFDLIGSLYELRVSCTKLIRDVISLVNQGWTLKSNQLKFKIYSGTEDQDCVICMESILRGNSLELKCRHIYHLDCIIENLMEIGPASSRCPVCRKEIISYNNIKKELVI